MFINDGSLLIEFRELTKPGLLGVQPAASLNQTAQLHLRHRNSAEESETKEAVSPSTVASIACALAESSSADTQGNSGKDEGKKETIVIPCYWVICVENTLKGKCGQIERQGEIHL